MASFPVESASIDTVIGDAILLGSQVNNYEQPIPIRIRNWP